MKRLKIFLLCLLVAGSLAGGAIPAFTQTDIIGLVVDSVGRVGIGTTAPVAGLEIYKGSSNDTALMLTSSGTGLGSGMVFRNISSLGRSYGIYSDNNGLWRFADATQNLDRMVIDRDGRVGLGTRAPTAGLEIDKGSTNEQALELTSSGLGWGSGMVFKNTGASGRNYGIYSGSDGFFRLVDLSTGGGNRLIIDPGGGVSVENGHLSVQQGNVAVNGALFVKDVPKGDKGNAQWDTSSGQFYYDTSSMRDKRNIRPLEDDFFKLLKAEPRTYTRPHSPGIWEIGYLAEDFERLGLSRLVRHDKDGRPESINYTKMSLYMIEIQKRHDEEIKRFERKTDALEAEVKRLKALVDELAARRRPK